MPLTVSQILDIQELSGVKLIAGASGLTKNVTSVNVMEAPDIAHWLRGGEFLLSTGYQFRDNIEAFEDLIMTIHAAGAAALGFKNRFIQEFPSRAKDFANRIGLPILSLPLELPYSDIIRVIIMKTDEVENIRFSESVMRSFSEVLTEGGDIVKILHILASFLNCSVCFQDATTGNRFCSSEVFAARLSADEPNIKEKYPRERLILSHRTFGHFILETVPQDAMWRVIMEHAKVAILLALQRDIAAKQVEARYRNEFVQDLVTGNIRRHEEVINRAQGFGWNLLGSLRAVVFDIDDYKCHFDNPLPKEKTARLEGVKERIYSICNNEMRQEFQNLPYLTMSDFIVFVVNIDKYADFKAKFQKIHKTIQNKIKTVTKFTVTVGVGDAKRDFFGVAESYEEARKAIELMRPLKGSGGFYVWDEMGIFTILAPVAQSAEAKKFLSRRLEKLTQSQDLLHTLNVLVEQGWNLKAAARALHIHYNTIHYRYEKICELSGLDLSSSNTRLEMALAIKLFHLNPKLNDLQQR